MLKICNWIASLFGYRLMAVKTFAGPRTWTKPQNFKTIMVEIGPDSIDEYYA